MKKFTVKDFIFYNGPCFSCGNKVIVKLVYAWGGFFKELPQTLLEDHIDLILKAKYADVLTLRIFVGSNKYQASDAEKLKQYLKTRDIYITSNCKQCRNVIESNKLDFDNIGHCKAITINSEVLNVYEGDKDNYKIYNLVSDFTRNITEVSICHSKIDNVFRLTIPLLPLYKFKNKERLIKKLKTYTIFS